MLKQRLVATLCLFFLVSGCAPINATSGGSPLSIQSTPAASGNTEPVRETPTSLSSTLGVESGAILPQSPLQLIIDQPQDGDVIQSQEVTITGRTASGAVVSINENFTIADQSGKFTLIVHVDSGLQAITIEASNDAGEDVIQTLSVDIEP